MITEIKYLQIFTIYDITYSVVEKFVNRFSVFFAESKTERCCVFEDFMCFGVFLDVILVVLVTIDSRLKHII